MAEIRIGYFLEDIGHENFLLALVERIAKDRGVPLQSMRPEVRNATGGRGKVLDELQRFLRDVRRDRVSLFHLLIVAIDGNCQGYREIRDNIREIVTRSDYPAPVICAVPNPHIERWYLADPNAFQRVLEVRVIPNPPAYKCERKYYKRALRAAILQAGVIAPLGGVEYGAEIAEHLDLYRVGEDDAGFRHFVEDLRDSLAMIS